jgi:hypothetical protein
MPWKKIMDKGFADHQDEDLSLLAAIAVWLAIVSVVVVTVAFGSLALFDWILG